MGIKENMAKQTALWAGANWDEVSAYIGPNADFYREAFDRQKSSWATTGRGPTFKLSWHWGAFIPFLGIPWWAARKQWTMVAILVGLIVLVNVISLFFPMTGAFSVVVFMIPMLAKNLYVGMAIGEVNKVKEALRPGANLRAALANAGGINMTYGYIAGGICAGLILLAAMNLVAAA